MKLMIEDDDGLKTVVTIVRDEITIGRQEGNTIRLTERNVSRRHARLVKENGNLLIEDLGSYNGVRGNGEKITEKTTVKEGDPRRHGGHPPALPAERSRPRPRARPHRAARPPRPPPRAPP